VAALDILRPYKALGEAQLNGHNKFLSVFELLYDGLSEGQRRIADAILRQASLSTMVRGIPEVPAPFGYQLAGPGLWIGCPYSSAGTFTPLEAAGDEHLSVRRCSSCQTIRSVSLDPILAVRVATRNAE
jgi:hypothetical protein